MTDMNDILCAKSFIKKTADQLRKNNIFMAIMEKHFFKIITINKLSTYIAVPLHTKITCLTNRGRVHF